MPNVLDAQPTKSEVAAALKITLAVAEAIREAKEIPSGTLYTILMGRVDFFGYQAMIQNLKNAGLVKETASHLLTWTGPELA